MQEDFKGRIMKCGCSEAAYAHLRQFYQEQYGIAFGK